MKNDRASRIPLTGRRVRRGPVSSRAESRQGFNDREYTERAGKCKKFRVGSVVVGFYQEKEC